LRIVGLILPLAQILCTLLYMHGRWRSSPHLFRIIMTLNAAFFAYLSYRGHFGIYGEILTGLLLLGGVFHIFRMPTTKGSKVTASLFGAGNYGNRNQASISARSRC
jgi:hypothetical protein